MSEEKEKKNKLFHKPIVTLAVAAVFIGFIGFHILIVKTEGSEWFSILSTIKNVVIGDNVESVPSNNDGVSVAFDLQTTKTIAPIVKRAETVSIYPFSQENLTSTAFNFDADFNSNFSIIKKQNENSTVRVHYDSGTERLVASVPSLGFDLNGEKTLSNHISIAEISVASNSVVTINSAPSILNQFGEFDIQGKRLSEYSILEYRRSTTTDLLADFNPSFERGLWTGSVWDCTTEKEGNAVNMELSDDASDGSASLELSSAPGNACTNRTFNIAFDRNKLYKLSFDYKILIGDSARYYYRFSNAKNEEFAFTGEVFQPDNSDTDAWHTFEKILDTSQVEDITSLNIHLYAPAETGGESVVLYDNVKLNEYEFAGEHTFAPNVQGDVTVASGMVLKQGRNTLAYPIDETNKLPHDLASFETGLWRKGVWDCNEDKEKDKVEMRRATDASEGSYSLELSSNPGNACTNQTFDVFKGSGFLYKLSFDYKNLKGNRARYYYNIRSDDEQSPRSETIETNDHEWHTYETIIDPKIQNARYLDLFFYAPSNEKEAVTNLYDNVRLTEWLPKDLSSYYLYAENKEVLRQAQDDTVVVEWKPINRWKNRVILHGARDAFLLSYPEKFSERWNAYVAESKRPNSRKVVTNNVWSRISAFLNVRTSRHSDVPTDYTVPDVEANRQASKAELQEMMQSGLISEFKGKFVSKNFDGSIRNDNLRNGCFWETWFEDSIPSSLHYQVNNYSNAWWIDVEELCEKYAICHKNSDGTWEIELVVEHSFLRWWIRFITLLVLGAVGTIGFRIIRQRVLRQAQHDKMNI